MKFFKLFAALMLLASGPCVIAQPSKATQAEARPLTPGDLEAFLDGAIPVLLKQSDIPGATIAVVKDGQIFFTKGYGYADGARTRPVDPRQTLFRPGSISKLFMWTAVMQLVEQGKIDLDRDVNTYLDFKIPPAFGKPITMRHLMTHRGGFEERIRDFFVKDPRNLLPLGVALKTYMPKRIFEAGTVPAYSNYGAGLAGYIVERVSGEPFAAYIQRHVLNPLGMSSTSMAQPLPAPLMARLSQGFHGTTADAPQWYEYTQFPPAGAASTTAVDMAHFMIAHLQGGALGGTRILKPETAALMQKQASSSAPGVMSNGIGLGFYEENRNGLHIPAHGGGTIAFNSDLRLIPAHGIGLFISVNAGGANGEEEAVRSAFIDGFLDRYFPAPGVARAPAFRPDRWHGAELAGNYRSSRRTESHYFKFGQFLAQSTVTAFDDGIIEVSDITGPNGHPRRWREAAPYVWQQIDGQARLTAVRDGKGRIAYLTHDLNPLSVWQPMPAALDKSWNQPLFFASVAILAASLLLWPVGAVIRRRYQKPLSKDDRRISLVRHATSFLVLAFIGFWIWLFMSFVSLIPKLNTELDPWLRLVQLGGLIAVAGTAYTLFHAAKLWRRADRSLWAKIGTTAVALACVDILWVSVAFHLLWPSLS